MQRVTVVTNEEYALNVSEIRVGAKFVDPDLLSHPPHHRHHVVVEVIGYTHFIARHVVTRQDRKFERDAAVVARLHGVKQYPTVRNDLDGLVGDKVRVELKHGGALHAVVTAVYLGEYVIDGAVTTYVAGIELDNAGATTYSPAEINKIIRIGKGV